jgi:hypothetical protein
MLNNYLSMNREQLDENVHNTIENDIQVLTNTIKSEFEEISNILLKFKDTNDILDSVSRIRHAALDDFTKKFVNSPQMPAIKEIHQKSSEILMEYVRNLLILIESSKY